MRTHQEGNRPLTKLAHIPGNRVHFTLKGAPSKLAWAGIFLKSWINMDRNPAQRALLR